MKELRAYKNAKFELLYTTPTETELLHFSTIADNLIQLYEEYFGINIKPFKLINDFAYDPAPTAIRESATIYMSCPTYYNIQFAFQFSHELLHWTIPESVPKNLRWFEETLAVLSSIFFPPLLGSIDSEVYAEFLNNCFVNPLCVSRPSTPTLEQITILQNGSGTANFNDYGSYYNIAMALFPHIKEHPEFWKKIPTVCNYSNNLSFYEFWSEWSKGLPLRISSLFQV